MKLMMDRIMALFTSKQEPNKKNLVDAEVCPNCWGKQVYADEVREVVNDRSKTEHEQKAFVAQFVETHVTGIQLRHEDDKLVCDCCAGVFKKSSTNAN